MMTHIVMTHMQNIKYNNDSLLKGNWLLEGAKDYPVSDTYSDSLDSLFLVAEVHRQRILPRSYNIFGSFEQQSDNTNVLYLGVQKLLHKCIKPRFSIHR